MPYKSNQYKNFIRSARWQRLRLQHLKANPLCVRCKAKGRRTLATEVHHRIKCYDDPQLQMDASALESLCAPCHAPLRHDDARGYSTAIGIDGYPIDPQHPANRPHNKLKIDRNADKTPGGREK
jgi:5-methylcytosine-specific restriction enzyme A